MKNNVSCELKPNLIILVAKKCLTFIDSYCADLVSFFQHDNYPVYVVANSREIKQLTFTSNDWVFAIFLDNLLVRDIKGAGKIIWLESELHSVVSNHYDNVKHSDVIIGPFHASCIPFYKQRDHLKNSKMIGLGWSLKIPSTLKFNHNPINQILVSGAISKFYSFRQHVHKQHRIMPDKISWFKHPGYNYCKQDPNEFYFVLNQYLCCFCDAGIGKYIFKKHFEIIAAGSLLLGDVSIKDDLEEIGFVENVNCMLSSPTTFNERLEYILNPTNRDHVDDMRKKGMELSLNFQMETHTYLKLLKEFGQLP